WCNHDARNLLQLSRRKPDLGRAIATPDDHVLGVDDAGVDVERNRIVKGEHGHAPDQLSGNCLRLVGRGKRQSLDAHEPAHGMIDIQFRRGQDQTGRILLRLTLGGHQNRIRRVLPRDVVVRAEHVRVGPFRITVKDLIGQAEGIEMALNGRIKLGHEGDCTDECRMQNAECRIENEEAATLILHSAFCILLVVTMKRALKPPPGKRLLKTLERVLSKAGVGSRTEAREWIAARRVRINGRVITDPDTWVDLKRDRVLFDGKPLQRVERTYLLLYKPKGYLTTYDDPRGRPTIYD